VWSKCTAAGAISGAVVGLAAALCAWLGYTKANYGDVSLASTGAGPRPALGAAGCSPARRRHPARTAPARQARQLLLENPAGLGERGALL